MDGTESHGTGNISSRIVSWSMKSCDGKAACGTIDADSLEWNSRKSLREDFK